MRSGKARPVGPRPQAILAFAALLAIPGVAMANSAIAGPIFQQGVLGASRPMLWLGLTMTMCIAVEGAIYHYQGRLLMPYAASAAANSASLGLGFLVFSFVGIILNSLVIIPTLLSIASEALVVLCFASKNGKADTKPILGAVVIGNLVTNGLIVLYIMVKS